MLVIIYLTWKGFSGIMPYLKLEKLAGGYKVFFENGVYIGDILVKEDGFYDYWPEYHGGYWDEMMLRVIADKLKELNAPYQKELEDYFSKEPRNGCST